MENIKLNETDKTVWFKGMHDARIMWNDTAPEDAETQLYVECRNCEYYLGRAFKFEDYEKFELEISKDNIFYQKL